MARDVVHLINPESLSGATLCGAHAVMANEKTRERKEATCVWCKDSRLYR